jgi:hypothetical protein
MIPEKRKKPGLSYAFSDDGLELPVIDLTHPAFEFNPGADELSVVSGATLRRLKDMTKLPRFVQRYVTRRSVLLRDASQPFLGGMTTYMQKLGPENLSRSYASRIDLQAAEGIGPVCMRLRLRDVALSMAAELKNLLMARPNAPLHLLNIGGGAAADSLNALILLCREQGVPLRGREIQIHVLDLDQAGPAFAGESLQALMAEGSRLCGLKVSLRHSAYDWNATTLLRDLLRGISAANSVVAVSSEGGLFEYGSDDAILANLNVLREHASDDCVITGSVLRDERSADPSLILIKEMSRMTVRLLGLDAFTVLIAKAGWKVVRAVEGNPCYHVVSLHKAS